MASIDERLDALTQSVELLTSMHRDNETRFKTLATLVVMHETEIARFRKAVRAALEAWDENGNEGSGS